MRVKEAVSEQLRDEHGHFTKYFRVHCDQCQMLSINGMACHETGCPNMGARWDRSAGVWIKQRKCFECGCTVDADDLCCNAPLDDVDDIDMAADTEESE